MVSGVGPAAVVGLHAGHGVTPGVYLFRVAVVLGALAALGVAVYWGGRAVERVRPAVTVRGTDEHDP